MDKALDWKRNANGTLCASCGMFHLLVWKRLPDRQLAGGFVFRVINAIGDVYEGVRPDESHAIADAHHAAELLSGGVL